MPAVHMHVSSGECIIFLGSRLKKYWFKDEDMIVTHVSGFTAYPLLYSGVTSYFFSGSSLQEL